MSVSVLIPSFNNDLLMRCFASMEQRQPGSMRRVIVLDNGLSPKLRAECPEVQFVDVPADPFVFPQAFNRGVAAAPTGHAIVALGDDLEILTDNWLTKIEDLVAHWPANYGVITFEEERTRETRPDYHGGLYELSDVALGAGIVLPRQVLDAVGSWDETLVGYGFDDFDYGIRLWHAGYKLGLSDAVLLRNARQATAWVERLGSYEAVLARQDTNFEIFHRRWLGTVPAKPWVVQRPRAMEHFRRQACACRGDA